jgi:hypothetical protein
VTGWCLGIGAAEAPPDQWVYEGPEPRRADRKKGGLAGTFAVHQVIAALDHLLAWARA